jgi:tetratricopeptide (TPR) repeat protein
MTRTLRTILSILSVLGFTALMVPVYFFFEKNTISEANRLKKKARDEYFAREYLSAYKTYETLIDSMQVAEDASLMNYANAAFMSSNILKKGFYGRSGVVLSDTMLQVLAGKSQVLYAALTSSSENKIASMAYNQLGYSAVKGMQGNASDSVLFEALDYFKNALKRNPANDSARYNYELVKKVLGFPETIMSQTRALVAERRYREAVTLLETSMERDVRLRKQQEYLKRIKAVAGIDSTYQARRL